MKRGLPVNTRHLSDAEIKYRSFNIDEWRTGIIQYSFENEEEMLAHGNRIEEALRIEAEAAREIRLWELRERKQQKTLPSLFEPFWGETTQASDK